MKEDLNNKYCLSVIVPLYNEENLITELNNRITKAISFSGNYEILFVDDGSEDNTLKFLLELKKTNPNIKIIELSRNFGHQAAYTAGLNYASGEYIVMMDGDLQDPPEVIPEMYKKITETDFDIIYGKRKSRKEGFLKKILISIFHYIFNRIIKNKDLVSIGNFSIMSSKAKNALVSLQEKNKYLPGLRYYIGFKQDFVEYNRDERLSGKSKMSFRKLVHLAFDAIFSFSKLPIRISLIIGSIGILASIIGILIVLIKKVTGVAITGWTSTMISIFFFGSVQLFFLGVLGEYVFRIFTETKNRSTYFIRNIFD